jgi:PAS domain S-box-containing protein
MVGFWIRVFRALLTTAPFLGYIGSCVDITERREAEAELRTSQERMTMAAEAAQLGFWTWDISGGGVWLTDKLRELLGYSATEEVTYDRFLLRVHEGDRTVVVQAVARAMAQQGYYHSEYRVVLPDGAVRWLFENGRVRIDSKGTPVQLLGVSIDITERRRAEQESREVSSKLITAQEDERKRIARELHDDLNQRLALLSVEMEIFGSASTDTSGPARERLDSMTSQVKGLSSEVHRLSYQLHPAKLDQLGLVVATRTFCREVSLQSGIAVHFEQHDMPRDVGTDVALCLYRVTQEAVQNSVRHNGGAAIQVSLTYADGQIRLLISDEGKGFDVDHAIHNGGLGLVSMRERVRQVNGSIRFTSSLGKAPGSKPPSRCCIRLPLRELEGRDPRVPFQIRVGIYKRLNIHDGDSSLPPVRTASSARVRILKFTGTAHLRRDIKPIATQN